MSKPSLETLRFRARLLHASIRREIDRIRHGPQLVAVDDARLAQVEERVETRIFEANGK